MTVPAEPVAPAGPTGPVGPAFSWPRLKSRARSDRSRTWVLETEFFAIWVTAAYELPPSATKTAIVAMTFE